MSSSLLKKEKLSIKQKLTEERETASWVKIL
jgi:hypothetical protein